MKLKFLIIFTFFVYLSKPAVANEGDNDLSFYTGTFDLIDKEGDDKTSLFGVEHKNPNYIWSFKDRNFHFFRPTNQSTNSIISPLKLFDVGLSSAFVVLVFKNKNQNHNLQ